jgi:hypothetical protein
VAAYFTAGGSPPPAVGGNPADFYLDVITPGVNGSKADEFAERYLSVQKCQVDAAVGLYTLNSVDP